MSKWIESCERVVRDLLGEAIEIWAKGGWAMGAIALIAFVMFAMGMHIHLRLREKGRLDVAETTWRRWITRPNERVGPLGELLDFVTGGRTLDQMTYFFDQLRSTETAPFERDLKVMKVCVSAAPLVGLLGTVTGMLTTFGALASGAGGDQTMGMVASGISEALITTETGLVIALPGLFFQYQLTRRFARFKAFLAHVETVCTQTFYLELSDERRAAAREIAVAQVAQRLRERLAAHLDASNVVSPSPALNGRGAVHTS